MAKRHDGEKSWCRHNGECFYERDVKMAKKLKERHKNSTPPPSKKQLLYCVNMHQLVTIFCDFLGVACNYIGAFCNLFFLMILLLSPYPPPLQLINCDKL